MHGIPTVSAAMGQQVALKLLWNDLSANNDILRVNSHNSVPDVGVANGCPSMDDCSGLTLLPLPKHIFKYFPRLHISRRVVHVHVVRRVHPIHRQEGQEVGGLEQ